MNRSIVIIIVLLLIGTQAQGASYTETLEAARALNIANHPTWLKLLHYERDGSRSEVLSNSFFLSPNGRNDADAELIATIEAYFDPWGNNPDEHARCRFPGRYFWLSQNIVLPDYKIRETRCKRLERWALLDSVESVSLLLVSGYFGNPASTFGHGLLRLNTDSIDDQSGMFDLTLNYGALVPENENTLVYIARGLFGGYQAGFSDKYFYTHDRVYSHTEFRDIWEYRLNLSDYQRTLLILHIWEINGQKFTYYFLNKNCVYRLAELLDLVMEEELLKNARYWYIPVELFHRLNDIDQEQDSSAANLIQSIRYIPSSQRVLYHQLKTLSPDEIIIFNAVTEEGVDTLSKHFSNITIEAQIRILDALLAYQKYRLVAEEPTPSPTMREAKDRILLTRLRLPARPTAPTVIPELTSPAEGSPPMTFGVVIAYETNDEYSLRLNWSPYKQELVGQNSLDENELVVFDLYIGISDGKHKVYIDQLDLIRVRKLNTIAVPIDGENQWSWQLRLGVDRVEDNERKLHDGVASFGAGHAWKLNNSITGYGIVDLGAHTQYPYLRLRPHIGMLVNLNTLRAIIYLGVESENYKNKFHDIWGGQVQYQLSRRYSIRADISNETAMRATIGLNWYW